MAHFAKLNENNIVEQVIVVNNKILVDTNKIENEKLGIIFCSNLFGGNWIQTSYAANFRKNFASSGYSYDPIIDAFIPPKPYESWILNIDTAQWFAPISKPNDGNVYYWDENTLKWIKK